MSKRTWGYAGLVGEWWGVLRLRDTLRQTPLCATERILKSFIPILSQLHTPRRIRVSWVEFDRKGCEVSFHELEEAAVSNWEAVQEYLRELATKTSYDVGVSSLFVDMDTQVIEEAHEHWLEASAEFQMSPGPNEHKPAEVTVAYRTYIDVWLSNTYGENRAPRDNHEAAAQNRPRLEAFLREFAERAGGSLSKGQSQLYYFAITETGFRDVEALPLRTI